jgi:peroxiredoxin family protein
MLRGRPVSADGKAAPDKLSIIVYSGDYGRVHYALAMASAAAAINRPVTLFLTMGAIRALTKPVKGGWGALPVTDDTGHGTGAAQDAAMAEKGLATFEELLAACIAFKVTIMVCEMGLRAVDLTLADLRSDVPYQEGGIVSFLADASATGAALFI